MGDVPLSKVKTNQELFDNMFDLVFAVPGDDEALRMSFEDIVFVMEDVDAASKVVYKRKSTKSRRKGKGKEAKSSEKTAHAPPTEQALDTVAEADKPLASDQAP